MSEPTEFELVATDLETFLVNEQGAAVFVQFRQGVKWPAEEGERFTIRQFRRVEVYRVVNGRWEPDADFQALDALLLPDDEERRPDDEERR